MSVKCDSLKHFISKRNQNFFVKFDIMDSLNHFLSIGSFQYIHIFVRKNLNHYSQVKLVHLLSTRWLCFFFLQTGDVNDLDLRCQMTWWWNFGHVTRWTDTLEEDRGGLCLGSYTYFYIITQIVTNYAIYNTFHNNWLIPCWNLCACLDKLLPNKILLCFFLFQMSNQMTWHMWIYYWILKDTRDTKDHLHTEYGTVYIMRIVSSKFPDNLLWRISYPQ